MKIEYQKITNLLGTTHDEVPRFITKKWIIIEFIIIDLLLNNGKFMISQVVLKIDTNQGNK